MKNQMTRILSLLTALLMVFACIGFAEETIEETIVEEPELAAEAPAEEIAEEPEEIAGEPEEAPEEIKIVVSKPKADTTEGEYYIVSNGYALGNNNGTLITAKVTVESGKVTLPSGTNDAQYRWTVQKVSGYDSGSYLFINGGKALTHVDNASGSGESVAPTLLSTGSVTDHSAWNVLDSSNYVTTTISSGTGSWGGMGGMGGSWGGYTTSTTYYLYYSNTYSEYRTHNESSTSTSSHNTTLYAAGSTPVPPVETKVTVTFSLDGKTYTTQEIVSGNTATKPATPAKVAATGANFPFDWSFDEWYTDAAYTTKFDFTKAISANTTVYGRYCYETLMGDLDFNGKVNGNDATMILQAKVRIYELDAYQTRLADLSGNGTVGSEDATYALQTAARILDTVPVTLYK